MGNFSGKPKNLEKSKIREVFSLQYAILIK